MATKLSAKMVDTSFCHLGYLIVQEGRIFNYPAQVRYVGHKRRKNLSTTDRLLVLYSSHVQRKMFF